MKRLFTAVLALRRCSRAQPPPDRFARPDPHRRERHPIPRLARLHAVPAQSAGTHRPLRSESRRTGRRPQRGHSPPYDLLVLNYMGPRWGSSHRAAQWRNLFRRQRTDLVPRGHLRSVLWHGLRSRRYRWSAGADQGWPAYPSLIGARWDAANSRPCEASRLHRLSGRHRDHPISRGTACRILWPTTNLSSSRTACRGTAVLATASDDPAIGGTGKRRAHRLDRFLR